MPRRLDRPARAALLAAACLAAVARVAAAQEAPATSDRLRLGGDAASAWNEGTTRVVLIEGRATIRSDDAELSADRAVLWLTPVAAGGYDVKIALLGNARVVRGDVTREGGELYVTLATRPDVEISVADLASRDRSTNVYFLAGAQLRRQAERGEIARPLDVTRQPPTATTGESDAYDPTLAMAPTTLPATTRATTGPVTELPRPKQGTVSYSSGRASSKERTPDGRIALVISGNVLLVQQRANGDRIELQAEKAVVFTNWTDERQALQGGDVKLDRDFDSVYLEGDVRIAMTPGDPIRPEQTLRATRAVYEFGTDRAVLTDALLHSYDPAAAAPIVMRAAEMRKLGTDTYEAKHASITTSNFAVPSLSLSASKVTIRQDASTDGSTRTVFRADNVVPRIWSVPFFYFPIVYGTSTDAGLPLRDIAITNSGGFGTGINTTWGLFETFGRQPPAGIDASYKADYYSERGPALGFDTTYAGGAIDESTLQPFSFNGGLTAYGVIDNGTDRLGRRRGKPTFDDDFRGRIRWNHQQFLSDGWQVQAQAAYVSDATFLEEWFRGEFRNGLDQDTSLYLKRSVGNEVFSIVGTVNLNDIATNADQLQETTPVAVGTPQLDYAPITVERMPQVEYHKIGESFGDDRYTWVSNNSAAGLHFNKSYATLDGDYRFADKKGADDTVDTAFTGIPSYGYTGYTGQYVLRGDSRQEIAMPLGDDRVRFTPYAVGRYTAYSDSPGGGAEDRLLAGVGFRMSTQFFKTYEDLHSTLFDINRMRHIVEPQLNVFASAQTTDRDDVYVYDENIDGISDVVGAQFVIKQRFQTKRGGEGRYRSVDFFTLNTGVNVFANQHDEVGSIRPTLDLEDANSFRGVYYNSEPEASIARSTLFADSVWRVTDTTSVLSDVAWNIDAQDLATAAAGVAVQREPRTRYFAGIRYIGELNSTIGTVTFDYNISERYTLSVNQSFNLSEGQNQSTSAELIRRFEQFVITVTVYFDQIEDEGGIQFSISPRSFPVGVNLKGRPTGRS